MKMVEDALYNLFFIIDVIVIDDDSTNTEPLPRCDLCGMHVPEGWLIRHRKTACCNKNTQMMWRRRDMAIADRCLEATFSLTGEEDAERIKGVEVFKCLGRILDRSDNNWPSFLRNISKARHVWVRLGSCYRGRGQSRQFRKSFTVQ